MEVILKEDVPKLGSRGDVVKVAEGFGRNYLLPHKLAIQASKGNKAVVEQMKAAAVRPRRRWSRCWPIRSSQPTIRGSGQPGAASAVLSRRRPTRRVPTR